MTRLRPTTCAMRLLVRSWCRGVKLPAAPIHIMPWGSPSRGGASRLSNRPRSAWSAASARAFAAALAAVR